MQPSTGKMSFKWYDPFAILIVLFASRSFSSRLEYSWKLLAKVCDDHCRFFVQVLFVGVAIPSYRCFAFSRCSHPPCSKDGQHTWNYIFAVFLGVSFWARSLTLTHFFDLRINSPSLLDLRIFLITFVLHHCIRNCAFLTSKLSRLLITSAMTKMRVLKYKTMHAYMRVFYSQWHITSNHFNECMQKKNKACGNIDVLNYPRFGITNPRRLIETSTSLRTNPQARLVRLVGTTHR